MAHPDSLITNHMWRRFFDPGMRITTLSFGEITQLTIGEKQISYQKHIWITYFEGDCIIYRHSINTTKIVEDNKRVSTSLYEGCITTGRVVQWPIVLGFCEWFPVYSSKLCITEIDYLSFCWLRTFTICFCLVCFLGRTASTITIYRTKINELC